MRKLLPALMVVNLILAGCGRSRPGNQGPRTSVSQPPAEPVMCPLTGNQAPSGIDVERPALAVKIENAADARPQNGLMEADIVYEQLAEGGITRFNAIYHCSDAERLGPIRSARFVDADILPEYEPVLFAFAGAAREVEAKVSSTRGITNLSFDKHGDPYRRDRSRRAPHNLFSSSEELRSVPDARDVRGAPETGLKFAGSQSGRTPGAGPGARQTAGRTPSPAAASPAGAGGGEVQFSFGGGTPSRYTFDAASGKYLRFHGTQAHRSAEGEQIAVTNVVVLKVQVRPGTIRDAAGNLSPEITVFGSGDAQVFSGGRSITGKWNRSGASSKTSLTDPAGAPLELSPGNTWIHLLPATQQVTVR